VGTFSNGFVVPNVIHNGVTDTTAVGIINQAGASTAVYWVFFDQESNHVTDGCFALTNKDYESFIWAQQSGAGLEGKRGYLVFAAGATTAGGTAQTACAASALIAGNLGQLSANAFHVATASQDVAFVPVIDGPLTIAAGQDLTTMGPTSVEVVAGAAQVNGPSNAAASNATFSMRYAIDGATNGLDTRVVVWSTGNQKGTHTVNIYDDKQNRKSVNFALTHAELDWFDPETISGLPTTHRDGFIEWNAAIAPSDAPATGALAALGGSVFTYSVITAPAFGAVQSVLGSHK